MEKYEGTKFITLLTRMNVNFGDEIMRTGKMIGEFNSPDEAGNISTRHGRGMLITASGTRIKDLTHDDLVVVNDYDPKKNTVTASGLKKPSSEVPMHWMLYGARPDANAIIHLHDLQVLKNYKKLNLPSVHKAPYGTEALGESVAASASNEDYIVIPGHGSVCIGKDLEECIKNIIDIHKKAR